MRSFTPPAATVGHYFFCVLDVLGQYILFFFFNILRKIVSACFIHSCFVSLSFVEIYLSVVVKHYDINGSNSSYAVENNPRIERLHVSCIVLFQVECDPQELETFAERFKQRRIKLGVTQADVGK